MGEGKSEAAETSEGVCVGMNKKVDKGEKDAAEDEEGEEFERYLVIKK